MKIAFIANIRMPTERAHGAQITAMCEAFSEVGEEITLVVPRRINPTKGDPFDYYNLKRNFSIVYMPVIDLTILGRFGFLFESLSFSLSTFIYTRFTKFDLYYSRDEFPLFLLKKSKSVYESHTGSFNKIAKYVALRVKTLVTISEGLREFYIKSGIPKEKIFVAADGVNLDDFKEVVTKEAVRKKLQIPLDKKIIMYIGGLGQWKGVDTLLGAAKRFKEDQQLVIIGGSEAEVEKLSKENPNVMFLGFLPYRDIHTNQQAADVLVLPNTAKDIISVSYTSPLKLFTYMASDRPMVVSDLPSIREIVDEETSYFFEPDNPKSLSASVTAVFENQNEAKQKANKARELVEEYTWIKRAKHIRDEIIT